jgi:hypothetical protein
MKPGPSLEAASCAASQGLTNVLWNMKTHHRVHKSPPLVPILSQINPVHTTLFYIYKIHFSIIKCTAAGGSVVGLGTMLQAGMSRVQFPMRSLDFLIYVILPAALWSWGRFSL